MTSIEPANPPAIPIPYKVRKSGNWVWRCSDASIQAGCPSVVAVAEVLVAVLLYGWLASRFDWPWMVFIGLVAAPMLLLRSPRSIEAGVEMLARYWRHMEEARIPRRIAFVLDILAVSIGGLAAYSIATIWLPGHAGYALLWRSAALGMFALVAGLAAASSVGRRGTLGGALAASCAVPGPVADAGLGAVGVAVVGTIGGVAAFAATIELAHRKDLETLRVCLVGLPFTLAFMASGLLIRWFATLRHLPSGLSRLPQNWRETLMATDLFHPPELLPQAGRVNPAFTVKALWTLGVSKAEDKALKAILIPAWYLPALAYRWSLKASAWLWWPLALALASPLEGVDGQASRERTAKSVGGAWAWMLLLVPATVFAWLSLSLAPSLEFLLHILPSEAGILAKTLVDTVHPPALGVRYFTLWIGCVLAFVLWWRSRNLKATHGKVLESPNEFNNMEQEENARFLELARPIEKIRLLFIVVLLVFGEASAAIFFHSVNPHMAEKLIGPWLLHIL